MTERRIILATSQDRAGVRLQMGNALAVLGEVQVIHTNKSARLALPQLSSADLLVVDARFLSHAMWRRLQQAARNAGCPLVTVRAGVGGLLDAVAQRLPPQP
jgi:hypothetical protein